jgi:four helix bundle protein
VKSERQPGVAGSFRDLRVSKLARAASAEVFEISKPFPRLSLTDRIRRSARATKAMISDAWATRRCKPVFVNKLDEALGEANETRSGSTTHQTAATWMASNLRKREHDWRSIASMLARMIDRAADFCKYAADPDYRTMGELMENWDTTPLSRTIRLYERLLPFTFHFSPFTSSQLCPP